MVALARTRSGRQLDLWTGIPGIVCAAQALTYHIDDISTATKYATPVQVYPAPVGSTCLDAAVDLVADLLNASHYAAKGFAAFLATYAGTGRHRITWSYTYRAGDANMGDSVYGSWFTPDILKGIDEDAVVGPVEVTEEFDVIAGVVPLFGYCLPSDLRDEGLTTTDVTDARLVSVIRLSSQLIERMTGRVFEPQRRMLMVDGSGSHMLHLDEAIIWVEKTALASMFMGEPLEVNTTDIRVYNRHLLCGMLSPDDRLNPLIELLRFGTWTTQLPAATAFVRWPKSTQNVMVTGIFGCTDPDPAGTSATGVTPETIRHACKLLCMREFPKLTDYDNREDRQRRHRLQSETTDGYSQTFSKEEQDAFGVGTELGMLLEYWRRPPYFGAA